MKAWWFNKPVEELKQPPFIKDPLIKDQLVQALRTWLSHFVPSANLGEIRVT